MEECDYCHDNNLTLHGFNCNHQICSKCLYYNMFCYHIKDIQNSDRMIIKCKCKSGIIEMNMPQLHDFLNTLKKNEESTLKSCRSHSNEILDYYCKDCNRLICKTCDSIGQEHFGHRVDENNTLMRKMKDYLRDFLCTLQPMGVFEAKFEEFSDKVRETVENKFNNTIGTIKDLIESLIQFQKDYVEKYQNEVKRIIYNLKILKMFYKRFYQDLNDIDKGDIFFLRYINNIGYYLGNLQIEHKPHIDHTLNNVRVEIDDLNKMKMNNLRVEFQFKEIPRVFRLVHIVQNAHKKLIKEIIQLSDDRIVTAGEDEVIRIWQETINGFRNKVALTKFIGTINALLPLKDKRFISAGANKEIRVWLILDKETSPIQIIPIAHKDNITSLAKLKDGRIISGSKDQRFIIWVEDGDQIKLSQQFEECETIYNIIPLYDSRIIISTATNIHLWKEVNEQFELKDIFYKNKQSSELMKTICQLRDGRLATGGKSCTLTIWEEKEIDVFIKKQEIPNAHASDINTIIELHDGRLASASNDRYIIIWKMNLNRNYINSEMMNDYHHGMYSMIQLNDGRLCSTSSNFCLVIWKDRSDFI